MEESKIDPRISFRKQIPIPLNSPTAIDQGFSVGCASASKDYFDQEYRKG